MSHTNFYLPPVVFAVVVDDKGEEGRGDAGVPHSAYCSTLRAGPILIPSYAQTGNPTCVPTSAERGVFQRVQMGVLLKADVHRDGGGLAQAVPETQHGLGFQNLAVFAYCLDSLSQQVVPVGKALGKKCCAIIDAIEGSTVDLDSAPFQLGAVAKKTGAKRKNGDNNADNEEAD
ncbi:hypothetical protein FA95DRAFT_1574072 [Auriscalpium vulgare]|uniref:Uncharacterized protein n=1 Tax=Auriscalpium vulgare TaxID=40419 RepID=A0ACB8RMX8_9AGAM|nr:hypothetical protein FA95DRAFT_1574072 [Auriscalpium vulgare]